MDICLRRIIRSDPDPDLFQLDLEPGDSVALLVNNLGATTALEIGVIVNDAVTALGKRDILVTRVYQGHFMTSLDMTGFSITILKIVSAGLLALLDIKVLAPAWTCTSTTDDWLISKESRITLGDDINEMEKVVTPIKTRNGKMFAEMLRAGCIALIASEDILTEFDKVCGDGDCGMSHSKGKISFKDMLLMAQAHLLF